MRHKALPDSNKWINNKRGQINTQQVKVVGYSLQLWIIYIYIYFNLKAEFNSQMTKFSRLVTSDYFDATDSDISRIHVDRLEFWIGVQSGREHFIFQVWKHVTMMLHLCPVVMETRCFTSFRVNCVAFWVLFITYFKDATRLYVVTKFPSPSGT